MAEIRELNPKDIYTLLEVDRSSFEDRAEKLAKLTIPFLFPTDSATGSDDLANTYASRYSGIAVNGLAAQMVLTLLPASGSSFRFDPNADALLELTEGDADAKAEIMAMISGDTNRVNKEIENQMIRPQFYEFMQTMVAVSCVLVEKVEGKGIKWHGLRNFVVKLNDMGEPLQIVVLQELDPTNLPEGIDPVDEEGTDKVLLYTLCDWYEDKWTVTTSIGSEIVGNEKTYKNNEELPYVYLGWIRARGDQYHRPYAEQFMGILEDYADMNKISVDGALIASKVIPLVNPLGVTRKADLANAVNGQPIDGREEDIGSFKTDKAFDFRQASEEKNVLMQQIDKAFLSRQGTQRQAERVTAEEVRMDAQELEKNLVGMYSIMSKKFSKWLVKQIMGELKIKFEAIDVNVITGLDALGKNVEAQQLDRYIGRLANLEMVGWLKETEILTRYAAAEGIDIVNLLKTPDEMAKERQAQQEAQQQAMLAESMASEGGKAAANASAQQSQ